VRVLNRPATWVAANINAPQANESVQPANTSALGDWVSIEHITSLSVQVAVSGGNAGGALVQIDVSNDFATGNTTGKLPTIPSTITNIDTLPSPIGLTLGAAGAYFLSIITPEGAVKAKWARIRYTTASSATGTITARWEGSGQP
jgi:hypothetical protein